MLTAEEMPPRAVVTCRNSPDTINWPGEDALGGGPFGSAEAGGGPVSWRQGVTEEDGRGRRAEETNSPERGPKPGVAGSDPVPWPRPPRACRRAGAIPAGCLGLGPGCELKQQRGVCPAPMMTSERREPFSRCHGHQPPESLLIMTVENSPQRYGRRRLPHFYTTTAHHRLF